MNVIGQAITVFFEWLGTTGLAQTIVKTAISYGLTSVAQKQLARGSSQGNFQNEASRRLTTVRASAEPRRIVYGQMRVGGVLTYAETHGEDNKYLNMVITLTGHEIEAIDTILWGDTTLTFSGSDGDATNTELQHPKGFGSLLFASKNLGSDAQTADTDLTGLGLSWGTNHRQRGCANIYLRLHAEQERMNAIENLTAIIRGKKVYDPRTATTVYSNNAALCVADYLMDTRYGFGIPLAKIDEDALIAAANVCDEAVTLNPSGTEARYTINGSFDSASPRGKTLQDMVNAMAGTVVWSGGIYYINAGAYTAPTITLTEDHLRGGLQIKTLDSVSECTNRVRGIYANPDANYQIDDFPTVVNATYLSEDNGEEHWRDIELPFTTSYATAQRLAKIDLERSRQEITVQFPAQAHALQLKAGDTVGITNSRMGWTAKVFDVLEITIVDDNGYLGADLVLKETASTVYTWANGEETVVDPAPNTDLPDPTVVPAPTGLAVTSGTAELIAKASGTIISRARMQWTRPASEFAGRIEVEYKKSILLNDGAMTALGTTLTSAYPFFQENMVGKSITVAGAGVAGADLVTTVASFTNTGSIELTDAASTTVASADVSGEFWIVFPWLPADATEQYITGVWDGEDYDFRVRSHSVLGYKSSYATVTGHTILGKTEAPSVPTDLAVTPGVNSIIVTWTPITDIDGDKTWVQWDTDSGFGTATHIVTIDDGRYVLEDLTPGVLYYIRIRSQDTSRILSAYTASEFARPYYAAGAIPNFEAYGNIGGTTDFTYVLNVDRDGLPSDGSIKIVGNKFIDPVTGTVYAKETDYEVFIPDYGTGADSPFPFFLAHLKSDLGESLWPAGVFPNTNNPIVALAYNYLGSTGVWSYYIIGSTYGTFEDLPTGNDYSIIATGFLGTGGKITDVTPRTSSPEKPLELELEYASITSAKAESAAKWATVPDGAPVRIKEQPKAYWDATSTASADDLSVLKPTAVTTGRIVRDFSFISEINIVWAGAVTTAAADNTAAINLALSTEKRVYIPAGTFEYSGLIDISDERTVYGASHGTSVLKANHADARVSVASNSRVSNFRIDGDDIAEFGLIAAFGSGAYVEHIRILNHIEAGLCLDGTQNSTFINLKISNNKRNVVLANDARNNWFLGVQTRFSSATIASHADNRHLWAGLWTHTKLATPPYGGQTIIRNMFLGCVFESEHGNDYALEFVDGGLAGHGMSFYQTEITSYPDATACVKVGADFGTTIDFNNCKFENAYAFDLDAGSHVRAFHCYYTGGGAEGKHLGTGRLDLGVDQLDVGFNALSKRDAINNSVFHFGIGDWTTSGTATVAHNSTTKVMDVTSPSTTGNSGAKVQPARLPTMIAAYTGRVVEVQVWIENNLAQREITALTAGTDRITLDTTDWNVIADFDVGDEVIYIAGDSDIGGLTNGDTYYVSARSATEMGLENTPGSGDIDLTGTLPTGTHYIRHVNPPIVLRWITYDGSYSTRDLGTIIDGMNTFWDRLQGDEVGVDMISQKVGGQSWSVGMVKTIIH